MFVEFLNDTDFLLPEISVPPPVMAEEAFMCFRGRGSFAAVVSSVLLVVFVVVAQAHGTSRRSSTVSLLVLLVFSSFSFASMVSSTLSPLATCRPLKSC